MKDAIPVALIALACILEAAGCFTEKEREGAPALLVYPPEAQQGDMLAIGLSAQGVDFNRCAGFTENSLEFLFESGENLIKVHSVDMLTANSLRAFIDIDSEAAAASYVVRLRCDPLTTFEGSFKVRPRSADLTFRVEPDSLPAGSQEQWLNLIGETSVFDGQSSYVMFDDGSQVVVLEQVAADETQGETQILRVKVNISPSAPVKEIEVVVVTGSKVARGRFTITDYVQPTVWLDHPQEVERPSADEGEPRQYTLSIQGAGVNFKEWQPDAGPEDPSATRVSFPFGENDTDSPGIVATMVNVLSQTELQANISVYDYAYIGVTRLRVTTGEQIAETTLTVTAAQDDPSLGLFPRTVTRGCKNRGVLAKAHNFEFEKPVTFACLQSGCSLKYWPSDSPSKQVVLSISIDAGFPGDSATLEAVAGDRIVRESLIIAEPLGPSLKPIDDVALVQGSESNTINLELMTGEFDPTARAAVLPRSGLKIVSQNINETGTNIELVIDVADDAPTGPALIRVETATETLEALTYVSPSHEIPWFSVQPDWIAQGRRFLDLEIAADGFELIDGETEFSYDDPAIRTKGIVANGEDTGSGRLSIEVSPLSRSDIIVIYAGNGGARAAATFHVLKTEMPVATGASLTEIDRGRDEVVSVHVDGMEFGAAAAQVMDNIGVTVSDVKVDPLDSRNAAFRIYAEEEGPGGWIGVLLMSDWQSVVVPIYIDADDTDPLTMQTSLDSIPVGSRPAEIEVTLPSQALLTGSSEILTGIPGVYATTPEISDSSNAKFLLDVRFDVGSYETGAPVFATASKGAAVGFVELNPVAVYELDESSPWQKVMSAGETALLEVDPGQLPSLLYSNAGREGFADPALELLSANALDAAETSYSGFIWIVEENEARIIASMPAEPAGAPSEIRIKSIGAGADYLPEEDAYGLGGVVEWNVEEDPCATPVLLAGSIDEALDVDTIGIRETSCKVVIAAMARTLADRPWSTPDLVLRLTDSYEQTICESRGWPAPKDADPRLFPDSELDDALLSVSSENGSAGQYLLNIRQPLVISELSRLPSMGYIELEIEESADLNQLTLELLDAETGAVIDSFSFLNKGVVSDGIVVIGAAPAPDVDIVDPIAVLPEHGAFALKLYSSGKLVDAVQIGNGDYDFGEGETIPDDDDMSVFTRVSRIDTNDNRRDFIGAWAGVPGR